MHNKILVLNEELRNIYGLMFEIHVYNKIFTQKKVSMLGL